MNYIYYLVKLFIIQASNVTRDQLTKPPADTIKGDFHTIKGKTKKLDIHLKINHYFPYIRIIFILPIRTPPWRQPPLRNVTIIRLFDIFCDS